MVAVNTAMIRRLIAAATLSFAVSGAGAEETRYAPWGGDADQVQELVDALRRLVDEAEQARAADPRFLSDLRALANRHDRPWQTRLLSEDFRDGDFTRNPAWVRHSGKFEVTFSGLLSRAVAGGGDSDRGSGKISAEELAVDLLKDFLVKPDKDERGGQIPAQAGIAEISTPVAITNAFSLTATIAAERAEGEVALVVYQGRARSSNGYSVVVAENGDVHLLHRSRRGIGVIETARTAGLGDRRDHILAWTRARDGTMSVSLDGERLFQAVDRSLRDPFDGVVFVNRAGAYLLRTLVVDGAS